jgi:TonB family protein
MIETVSDIITARSREPEGLHRMIALSVSAHVLMLAVLMFAPKPDFTDDTPRTVMTVSLGGAPGPRTGMTPIGGRAVQAPQPIESRRSRAETAPAPKAPEMSLPRPNERPRQSQARPTQAPRESTARTPSTGPDPREGNARAETGARGQGFGLSAGGGGGTGGAKLDVANFCCPEYVSTFVQRIQQNWNQNQGVTAEVVVKFTIQRDGTITDVQVERPSGFIALDMAAQRAVLATARVPPLPTQFTNPTLTVHLTFDYNR